MDYDSRITNSDGASYNANLGMRVYGNTHGINAGYPSSRYSLSCMVIGAQDDDMQRDYAYTVSRKADLLQSASAVGIDAAKATVDRLAPVRLIRRTYLYFYTATLHQACSVIMSVLSAVAAFIVVLVSYLIALASKFSQNGLTLKNARLLKAA